MVVTKITLNVLVLSVVASFPVMVAKLNYRSSDVCNNIIQLLAIVATVSE